MVNAVSLYVERGKETFHTVHVAAAERLADEARKAGVERLVQISGIGADAAVVLTLHPRAWAGRAGGPRGVFAGATVIRPAVMFGPDDAFLNTLIKLLRRLPVYPMFGRGETRLQPADVEDVAEAVAKVMQRTETGSADRRVRRAPRLFLRRAAQNDSARSERETDPSAGAFCRLAWLAWSPRCCQAHRLRAIRWS